MADQDHADRQSQENEAPQFVVRDRRFWAREGDDAGRRPPRSSPYPAFVEELRARVEASAAALSAAQAGITKAKEEGEALRKRLSRDLDRRLESARGEYLNGFLEVLDNFDLAIRSGETSENYEALLEGIRMVRELFFHRLAEYGVTPIDVQGGEFDPKTSEAIGLADVDDADLDGAVVEVVRRGFLLNGELFRPAQVRVGRFALPKTAASAPAAAAEEPPAAAAVPFVEEPPPAEAPLPAGSGATDEDEGSPPLNPAEVEF